MKRVFLLSLPVVFAVLLSGCCTRGEKALLKNEHFVNEMASTIVNNIYYCDYQKLDNALKAAAEDFMKKTDKTADGKTMLVSMDNMISSAIGRQLDIETSFAKYLLQSSKIKVYNSGFGINPEQPCDWVLTGAALERMDLKNKQPHTILTLKVLDSKTGQVIWVYSADIK